jgi:hypothetical protein
MLINLPFYAGSGVSLPPRINKKERRDYMNKISDIKVSPDYMNLTYGYNISHELYEKRHKFCLDVVKGKCEECPISKKYYADGVSCTGALDKYPSECELLINSYEA